MPERFAGLIATVGGTSEPLLKTLADNRPRYVLFVVSEGSSSTVANEIVPNIDHQAMCDYLDISDPNDMGVIYRELRDGRIEHWLEEHGLDAGDVYLDITGGTKAMSAALALAGVEQFNAFSYVGGTQRNKGNLGTVVSGSEYLVATPNPWDTYAVRDLDLAGEMLAGCHADAAAGILNSAAEKCSPDVSRQLEQFASLARMLSNIDRFNFSPVPQYLNGQGFTQMETRFPGLAELGNHWRAVSKDLAQKDTTPGRATLLELLANAQRRASQYRYDDAVARIYRAVELYAQQLVKKAFGVELGQVPRESAPSRSRDASEAQSGIGSEGGRRNLGLAGLYQCLKFSDDPQLRAKAAVYHNLDDQPRRKRMDIRHQSLLAHGVTPVDRPQYRNFLEAALRELGIREDEIPNWPALPLTLR